MAIAVLVSLAICAYPAVRDTSPLVSSPSRYASPDDSILAEQHAPRTVAKPEEPFVAHTKLIINGMHALGAASRSQPRIVRRANWDSTPMATDEVWCRAQAKGAQMYAAFWKSDLAAGRSYNPPRQSANSIFRSDNMNNMMYSTWGWSDGDNLSNDANFDRHYGDGWLTAMRERGIGIEPWKDVWSYYYQHGARNARDEQGQPFPLNEQTYMAYGKRYQVTGARAKFGVQDKAGAIMVNIAVSPASAFRQLYGRDARPDELPQLRSLSDLLWAGWIRGSNPHVGNPNPANLNYMFMMWVINEETLSIMKRALKAKGKDKYSVWPGDDFSTREPEGQALLGSPNGKPMGYLVNQRKQDMGVK